MPRNTALLVQSCMLHCLGNYIFLRTVFSRASMTTRGNERDGFNRKQHETK